MAVGLLFFYWNPSLAQQRYLTLKETAHMHSLPQPARVGSCVQSIQYLLKLLGLNHSQRRVRVVGCSIGLPFEKMGDSAHMDTCLHKTLLDIQAEQSGNIPRNRWIR